MSKRTEKTEQQWRQQLSDQEFEVCRRKGTERPFSGRYTECKDPGLYRCKCCGQALFDAGHKFDSGTGWPSFWQPVQNESVLTHDDPSHGMQRTEVLCAACDAHLGHVFEDGPAPTGLRYCINSVALELDPEDK